jgi:hypothetical protein
MCRKTPRRVKRFLEKTELAKDVIAALDDPRDARGKQWPHEYMVDVLLTGAVLGCPTMKEVERKSEKMGLRIPDSSLARYMECVDPSRLRRVLIKQVKQMHRAKALGHEGLPCGVLTIDGKQRDVQLTRARGRPGEAVHARV